MTEIVQTRLRQGSGGQEKNSVLREKAKKIPVAEIQSQKIKNLLKLMSETLKGKEDGIALAAPQIGESLQVFIVRHRVSNISTTESKVDFGYGVFINPKIIKTSQKKNCVPEGCLSIEGMEGLIKRAEKVIVEALDAEGNKFTRGASGLMAQIIQHEVDHLNGILFIDTATNLHKLEKDEK